MNTAPITHNLLALLRAGAFDTKEQLVPLSAWKWRKTFELANDQGVAGTTGMGVKRLSDAFFLQLPDDLRDRWLQASDKGIQTTDDDVQFYNALRQRALQHIVNENEDEATLAMLKNMARTLRQLVDGGPFLRPLTLLALNVRSGRQWVDYELMKQWIKRLHLQGASHYIGILMVDLLHIDPKDVLFTTVKNEDCLTHAERFSLTGQLSPRTMGLFKYAPTESLATLWGAWVVKMKSVEE